MTTVLRANGLHKQFGETPALAGADIAVAAGEFVALLGPSGAGKTTLFRCLTRLEEPDSGKIFLGEWPIHGLHGRALALARRQIGVVFQQFNLVRRLTALENVLAGRLGVTPLWRVALRRFSNSDNAQAAVALGAVGLAAQMHQRADTLSGGQQQRVAIARALVQESRVILADEPVASLDPASAESVLALLKELTRSHGIAVLCTLHQPHLANRFADRVVAMNAGRIVAAH